MKSLKSAEARLRAEQDREEALAVARGDCAATPEVARALSHYARGDSTALARALDLGANPNLMVKCGGSMASLLGVALTRGAVHEVEILLAAGADIEREPGGARGVLSVSIRKDDARMAQVAITAGACVAAAPERWGENQSELLPLTQAVAVQATKVIEVLLRCGADPNGSAGDKHLPPLHLAARRGDMDLCALLVKAGAEVGRVSMRSSGRGELRAVTAAGLARTHGHEKVADWLDGFDLAHKERETLSLELGGGGETVEPSGTRRKL